MSTTHARHARFEVNLASGDVLDVRRFTVHERISALFSVTVTAVSPSANLDFEAVIGQGARFAAHAGLAGEVHTRVWTGICRTVREVAVEEAGLSTYEIEIVPVLWLASQRRNHRMFQLLSDVDIVRKVLSEWGIEPELRLSAAYKKRKYRVQYGESDYAFVCRLLEDSGVSFYFAGDSGEIRLVLSDAPETNDPRDPRIPFRDRPGDADLEHVTRVRAERQVRPGRYTLRDHDYRRPPLGLHQRHAANAGEQQRSPSRCSCSQRCCCSSPRPSPPHLRRRCRRRSSSTPKGGSSTTMFTSHYFSLQGSAEAYLVAAGGAVYWADVNLSTSPPMSNIMGIAAP